MSKKRYPLRVARTAHGIRAQDLRTLVRSAWWARRWIGALEAMRLGPRLGRGRQYAVAGQVTDLMLEGAHVEAKVMGSRHDPYKITLDFTSVKDDVVANQLKEEPMLMARLLTDDLPIEIEEMMRVVGVPLCLKSEPLGKTPEGKPIFDVKMKCSCPDWARPCKHIVAVLLLLGEEIAHHPSTLLSLRGIDIDEMIPQDVCGVSGDMFLRTEDNLPLDRDLTMDDPAPLLKRLGAVPFWRGNNRCLDALSRVYKRVRPIAAEAADGKSIDLLA